MVKETRLIFDVTDIKALRIKCKRCLNELAMRLESEHGIPDDCPVCRTSNWAVGTQAYALWKALQGPVDTRACAMISFELAQPTNKEAE